MSLAFDDVVAFLRDPAAYAHRPPSVEVRETAISIVLLAGDRVLKVKKPVAPPFWTTRIQRNGALYAMRRSG